MGFWEFLQQWPQRRIVAGALLSAMLHGLLLAVVLWQVRPGRTAWVTPPGDALIVELPKPEEPAPAGRPGPSTEAGPVTPEPPAPPVASRPRPPAPKREVAKKAEPRRAPVVRPEPPAPAPRPAPAPEPPQVRRPEPAPSPPPVRRPEPAPSPPPVRRPEPAPSPPPVAPAGDAPLPAPPPEAVASVPAPPPEPPAATPEPDRAVERSAAEPGAPVAGDRQVASVPPPPADGEGAGAPAPGALTDIRAALGRRGAGGRTEGRGGIEGAPVPLDSPDPRYSDYFLEVRRRIASNWAFPCLKNRATGQCEYKTARVVIEFGIAKDGRVQFVDVVQSSGFAVYDDYAVNAIKLSSALPAVPDSVSRTGLPVLAHFIYRVETSLSSILR